MSQDGPRAKLENTRRFSLTVWTGAATFHGAFDDAKLVGVVVLDCKRIGKRKDQLQLKFLHVSSAYRNRGLGKRLFDLARAVARERGARQLYISATPSENTVNFYLRLGCQVADEPDPELLALEPEDIHLVCLS